jgi:hypothetical protein
MLNWILETSRRLAPAGAVVAGAAAVYGLLNLISQLAGIAFISAFLQIFVIVGAFLAYGRADTALLEDDPESAATQANRQATVLFGLHVLALAAFVSTVFVTALRPERSSASALVSGLWIPFGGILLGVATVLRYRSELKGVREPLQLASRCLVGAGVLGLGGGVLALGIARGARQIDSFGLLGLRLQSHAGADFWSIAAEGVLICALGIAFTSGALDDVAWISTAVGIMVVLFGVSEWIVRSRGYAMAVTAMGLLMVFFGAILFIRSTPRRLTQTVVVLAGMAGVAITVTAYGTMQPQVAVSAALLSTALLAYAIALNLAPHEDEASRRLEEGRSSSRLSFLHLQAKPSVAVIVRFAATIAAASVGVWALTILSKLPTETYVGPLVSLWGVVAALALIVIIQARSLIMAIPRRGSA